MKITIEVEGSRAGDVLRMLGEPDDNGPRQLYTIATNSGLLCDVWATGPADAINEYGKRGHDTEEPLTVKVKP